MRSASSSRPAAIRSSTVPTCARSRPGSGPTTSTAWIANPRRLVPFTAMPQNIAPHGTVQILVPKTFENKPFEMVKAVRDTLLNYVNAVELQLASSGRDATPPERPPRPRGTPRSRGPIPPILASSPRTDRLLQDSQQENDAMLTHWFRRPAILGLSLARPWPPPWPAAAVNLRFEHGRARSRAQQRDDQGARGRCTRRPRPAAARGRRRRSTASTAPVKAEGWGTLKGQVVFGGDPPAAKILQDKGKAAKNPEVCAKDGPIKSERLVVDPASKGVKNVLVYLPKPTAVNEDAKKAAAAAKIEFDQKGASSSPTSWRLMAGVPVTLKSSDPVNHNINVKLKNSTFNQTIARRTVLVRLLPRPPERTPGQVVCDIHPWMTLVVDGPRPSLLRGDRRQGILRDQERPGRHPKGRRLARGRQRGFRHAAIR